MAGNEIQRVGPQAITPERGGIMKQDGLGGMEMEVRSEVHAAAAAAKEEAIIRAKFTFALAHPRDVEHSRVKLMARCEDYAFADAAIYSKPVAGQQIEGLSVRFTEEAVRALGNISTVQYVSSEDRFVRRIMVSVIDLEANVDYSGEVTLEKTVERKNGTGRVVVGQRNNTSGQNVYIVLATEDELASKQNGAISKLKRNLQLNLIPGDMQAEARIKCEETLKKGVKADPGLAKKKVMDAFAKVGVHPPSLKAYLGKDNLDFISEKEIIELRALLAGIQSGETNWNEAFEEKTGRSATDISAPEEQKKEAAPPPAEAAEIAPQQQEIINERTGEVTTAPLPGSADEAMPDAQSQPVENFLWRLKRSTDAEVPALVKESTDRRADWGDRGGDVGSAVSARRKAARGGK